jgi:hypothetical protein
VVRSLVGHDLLDHAGQVGGRIGREPADGQVGYLVAVEVGKGVVGGDVRTAAERAVGVGSDVVGGEHEAAGGGGRIGGCTAVADEHHKPQRARGRPLADGGLQLSGRPLVGKEGDGVALVPAKLDPRGQRGTEVVVADDEDVSRHRCGEGGKDETDPGQAAAHGGSSSVRRRGNDWSLEGGGGSGQERDNVESRMSKNKGRRAGKRTAN